MPNVRLNLICLVSVLFCAYFVTAQDKYTVNATVIDNNKQPVFMASVVLRDNKNKLLSIVDTNKEGKATITVQNATNPSILVVSMIGYSSCRKEITFDDSKTLTFKKIILTQNAILDSVVVTAPRLIRRTRDAFVYDVEKDPKAKITKIVNLLDKLPFIEIGFNNEISIFSGSRKIAYLLNGKASPLLSKTKLTMNSITGINIKYIELLPNPPDNYIHYDAVINIVTRKSLFEGMLFGISETGSLSNQSGGLTTGFDIASNIKKFSFVLKSNISNNWMFSDSYRYNSKVTDTTEDNYSGLITKIETESYTNSRSDGKNFLFMGTYIASKKSSINFHAQYVNNGSVQKISGTNKVNVSPNLNYNSLNNTSYNSNILIGKISFSTQKLREKGFNLDYDCIVDNKDHKQLFDVYRRLDSTNTRTNTFDNNQSHKISFNKIFKMDDNNSIIFESYYSFLKNTTTGNLYNYNDIENIWEIDLNKNNYLKNLQHNAAFDLSYNFKVGLHSFSFKLDNTICSDTYYLKEKNQNKIYTNYWLFSPSITYSIIPKMGKIIKFQYKRINQLPDPFQINPYYNQVDPLYISIGNPNLKQTKTDHISIQYLIQKPKIIFGSFINYAHTWNSIESVKYINDQEATVSTYDNIGVKDIISFRLYFKYRIIWGLNAYSNVKYSKTLARIENSVNSIDNYGANVTVKYRVGRTLMMGVSGNIIPSRVTNIIQSSKSFYNFDTRLEISGNSKNMKFNWGVSINAFEKSFKTITTQDLYSGYILTSKRVNPGRTIEFKLSYSLGKIKQSRLKLK